MLVEPRTTPNTLCKKYRDSTENHDHGHNNRKIQFSYRDTPNTELTPLCTDDMI